MIVPEYELVWKRELAEDREKGEVPKNLDASLCNHPNEVRSDLC